MSNGVWDPLNWLSVLMMLWSGILIGLAGKYIVGVPAATQRFRFGQWQGWRKETIKAAYGVVAGVIVFAYPVVIRYILGPAGVRSYVTVYAFSAPIGIVGCLWVFALAKPSAFVARFRKEIHQFKNNASIGDDE